MRKFSKFKQQKLQGKEGGREGGGDRERRVGVSGEREGERERRIEVNRQHKKQHSIFHKQ